MRWKGPLGPSGANGPIARPANPRSTPPSPGRASANPGRLGARLPERRLSRAARQLGKPCRELWAPGTRFRELPVLVLADPEVSLRAGSPSLVAREISSAAGRPAQELEGACSRFFWDGSDHPQNQPRYPQAEACCPPVVHRFIHRRAHRRGRGPASTELNSTGPAWDWPRWASTSAVTSPGCAWRTWDQSSGTNSTSALTSASLEVHTWTARAWGLRPPLTVTEGDQLARSDGGRSDAPRGALLYPRCSREELGGRFLGLMADLDPKGEGDKSMMRHEALRRIPCSAGRNLEECSWV
jgi:hypothetical protein